MKKFLLVTATLAVFMLFFSLILEASVPNQVTTVEGGRETAVQPPVEQASSDNTEGKSQTVNAERTLVQVESNEQVEELDSPLVGLANYAEDMRGTPVAALPSWLTCKGAQLNHPPFRERYFKRWAISSKLKFDDNESAPHAIYNTWVVRSGDLDLDLYGALWNLIWSEPSVDVFPHWLQLLMHHRDKDQVQNTIAELKRYLAVYDRKAEDFPKRAKAVIDTLILFGALDNSLKTDLLDILSDPEIGKAVGKESGFSALVLLAPFVPYEQIQYKIPELLKSPSPEVQWGAVEMLRWYTSQGQLNAELMAQMIPQGLIEQDDGPRCAAALELLASYGGQNGLDRLNELVRNKESPRRGAALEFMSCTKRIDLAGVMQYAGDKALQPSVLNALCMLGKQGTDGAFQELRRYLNDGNPALRKQAAELLFGAHQLSEQEAASFGLGG